MKTFIMDDFLLHSDVARELYHEYARPLAIYDYHSHLPAELVASNHRFANLHEAWIAGDHYKWRAMRWNGEAEDLCTGKASPREKFQAFARTVPKALRNPLYHWTHMELKFYFGIDDLLDETTAESIWNRANERLGTMTVRDMLALSRVAVFCTTDDPADTLEAHQKLRADTRSETRVYPTFRPDAALVVDQPAMFNSWIEKLAAAAGAPCGGLSEFLSAIEQRHAFFHAAGGRLSDHGLSACEATDCTEAEAGHIYEEARAGRAAGAEAAAKFRSFMMEFFGRLDAARGWTKQLHLGPLRNTSTRALQELGPNTGFDSIGDRPQLDALRAYMDRLDKTGHLPQMVLYNVNPADNHAFAAMAGNFQDGRTPGKIQFGSAWWFLDQKDGIQQQLNALSNIGLLSRFVGMLTDSRSFLSFPRHDYFRRILCDLIGRDVVNGELPRDMKLLGGMVADICYHNAHRYFGLDVPGA